MPALFSVTLPVPRAARRWGPVLLWMAGIFVFSSLPRPLGPLSHTPVGDWIGRFAHGLEYAGLAALLYRAFDGGQSCLQTGWRSLLVTVAYAISDEIHQTFVPQREFSLLDLALDTVGALSALGILGWRRARGSPTCFPKFRANGRPR